MAIRLDAVGEELNRTANLPTNTAFTYMIWSVLDSDQGTGTFQPYLFALTSDFLQGYACGLFGDLFRIEVYEGGVAVRGNSASGRPTLGSPHCIFLRCSGTGTNLLTGGYREVGQNSFTTTQTTMGVISNPNNLYMGGIAGAFFQNGRKWNIKVWNRALSDAEILVESFHGRPQFPGSINFWWPLHNASDTADRSGNGRNATVVGSPTTGDTLASLWRPRQKIIRPSVAAASYELETSPGSYALTGSSARLSRAAQLHTTAGSYTLTGVSARLNLVRRLLVSPGSYSLTGFSARTERDARVNVTPGSYSLTGSSARLESDRRLEVSPGSYALTGSDAELIYTQPLGDFELLVTPGTYSITGSNAGLVADRLLIASPGSYSLTGSSARLNVARLLRTTAGSYALTGSSARLESDRVIRTTAGSYAITGFDAELDYQSLIKELIVTPGSYVITGYPAEMIAPQRRQGGGSPRRKGYIVKGQRYWLTDDELSVLLAQMLTEVKRSDVRRDTKKPKVLSHGTWARLQESMKALEAISTPPEIDDDEDDEEALLLLL